ncbi:MAG: DNA/RNA nuclease SfsA [Lachnospiraceae bacterium]|nr:DNA/RNA nuclease SfsA [Lachnospiraceae bacterium]
MTYANIVPAVFLRRPNRFIAEVVIDGGTGERTGGGTSERTGERIGDRIGGRIGERTGGETVRVHVKNTGRCEELLAPGVTVYLDAPNVTKNPHRSTLYDLVAVQKGDRLINMDSQAPNKAFGEFLRAGGYIPNVTLVKPEARYGDSRFDFYVESVGGQGGASTFHPDLQDGNRSDDGPDADLLNGGMASYSQGQPGAGVCASAVVRKAFIEVKGVTLEGDSVAWFPDAPTLRGVKHLNGLAKCLGQGYEAHAVFVVQMGDVRYFAPNDRTHPAFGEALRKATAAGVKVSAWDCDVTAQGMAIGKEIPVRL